MSERLRLATWNIARCRPNSEKAGQVQAWMDRVNADVWVLTETHQELAPGDGFSLVASSAEAPDLKRNGERWIPIWSRVSAEPVELVADQAATKTMKRIMMNSSKN